MAGKNNQQEVKRSNVDTIGIKNKLKGFDYKKSIAEYIWNGFDAGANTIDIRFESVEIGHLTSLSITDNGHGISRQELDKNFLPVFSSHKSTKQESNNYRKSLPHGKAGSGRYTFFCFCESAKWETVYAKDNIYYKYDINIDSKSLIDYRMGTEEIVDKKTGTTVHFYNPHNLLEDDISNKLNQFLVEEFGWFLELNREKSYVINVNGLQLNYNSNINESEEFEFNVERYIFSVKYIQWKERHEEVSMHYFINKNNAEARKATTKLNKKGDKLYHSLYIKSNFFDCYVFSDSDLDAYEDSLLGIQSTSEQYEIFKALLKKAEGFLDSKRKPFLRKYSDELINTYESKGILPKYKNEYENKYKKPDLIELVRGLYEIEPKLFVRLNLEQQKTLVGLLNLVLDSDRRDELFNILEEVIRLSDSEKSDLAKILKTTRLSNIISTIKLIEDRFETVDKLKNLLFHSCDANESHIQSLVESHYWLFGEQYHLVTAAEPDFEAALRSYCYILTGEDAKVAINHPDKNKEMDIFICRRDKKTEEIDNIIVELKHPKKKLGKTELDQVETYMRTILNTPQFNADTNAKWTFILVGNDYVKHNHESKPYIKSKIEQAQNLGEKSLVIKDENYKIYVKKWSEIINDFDIKHNFLMQKLMLEREKIQSEKSSNEIINQVISNTAVQPVAVRLV